MSASRPVNTDNKNSTVFHTARAHSQTSGKCITKKLLRRRLPDESRRAKYFPSERTRTETTFVPSKWEAKLVPHNTVHAQTPERESRKNTVPEAPKLLWEGEDSQVRIRMGLRTFLHQIEDSTMKIPTIHLRYRHDLSEDVGQTLRSPGVYDTLRKVDSLHF